MFNRIARNSRASTRSASAQDEDNRVTVTRSRTEQPYFASASRSHSVQRTHSSQLRSDIRRAGEYLSSYWVGDSSNVDSSVRKEVVRQLFDHRLTHAQKPRRDGAYILLPESIKIRAPSLSDFPDFIRVAGDLELTDCRHLQNLGYRVRVDGDLTVTGGTRLSSLGMMISVGGNITIKDCRHVEEMPSWILELSGRREEISLPRDRVGEPRFISFAGTPVSESARAALRDRQESRAVMSLQPLECLFDDEEGTVRTRGSGSSTGNTGIASEGQRLLEERYNALPEYPLTPEQRNCLNEVCMLTRVELHQLQHPVVLVKRADSTVVRTGPGVSETVNKQNYSAVLSYEAVLMGIENNVALYPSVGGDTFPYPIGTDAAIYKIDKSTLLQPSR